MSSQSHVLHCRVLPLVEFTVMIPEPHATLQAAVTWRNPCHPHATLQGVIIPSAILNIVFRHILFILFFNVVWALTSGGIRIVSDTLVISIVMLLENVVVHLSRLLSYIDLNTFDFETCCCLMCHRFSLTDITALRHITSVSETIRKPPLVKA